MKSNYIFTSQNNLREQIHQGKWYHYGHKADAKEAQGGEVTSQGAPLVPRCHSCYISTLSTTIKQLSFISPYMESIFNT